MGLLDDAIREHLELKRRRGADPGEVAREQQEVLDPLAAEDAMASHRDVASEALDDDGVGLDGSPGPSGRELIDPETDEAPAQREGDEPPPSIIGQETAELDMQTVLDEGPDPATLASPVEPTFTEGFRDEDSAAEPPEDPASLEDDEMSELPPQVPSQERPSFE
jgi:hypothetical protein